MTNALAMVVDRRKGQAAINLARGMNLVNHSLSIFSAQDGLLIPLTHPPDASQFDRLLQILGVFRLEERDFIQRPRSHPILVEALEERLPPHLLAMVPKSLNIVGHIAIIELPEELEPFRQLFGKAVLETSPGIRTVVAKAGATSSDYRIRELRLIAGEDNPVTRYREHGCTFELDVRTVFFSPRLSHERFRVASQVRSGETVVDMFAGVGPYSILIAKSQPKSTVDAVELNPSAFKFLVSNILTNRVLSNVRSILGDVREIVPRELVHVADRVIMNLPGKALDFVDVACLGLKEEGGVIHFYSFESAENPQETALVKLRERIEASGRNLRSVSAARVVKAVAPYKVQVALDAVVN